MTDFTQPGFYRTRSGRKAEVLYTFPSNVVVDTPIMGCIENEIKSWDQYGQVFPGKMRPDDLISPWVEAENPKDFMMYLRTLRSAALKDIMRQIDEVTREKITKDRQESTDVGLGWVSLVHSDNIGMVNGSWHSTPELAARHVRNPVENIIARKLVLRTVNGKQTIVDVTDE